MFKWFVILLVSEELLSAGGQHVRFAEKRVINAPSLDYSYQQLMAGQPGLSAYSDFVQKTPEPPAAGELHKNIRTIIVTKKVPVPYPVHVQKNIPYPVKVPVRRPYTVYVPRPYYVEVMKQVPFPVKVPIPQPYTVEKHVPVPYKVHYDKPYPVHVSKPYPVYFEKRVPIQIEKPVAIPFKVPVDRPFPIQIPVEKQVLFPVERPYPYPVKVPVEKPAASPVQKHIPVPVTVEKPQLASNEHSVGAEYYSSTQPTVHNTFSPSPYDEMTSTLITQGKHKVMSFLPGSQNNLGSYGDHSDIGTIHVSNIKDGGGNSTDWVPKQYLPASVASPTISNQYLTYIPNVPNTQPKYQYQYIVPEKTTRLTPVSNAEPYIVNHNSVKMHYKLHFDPVKQEYSFQLMPRPPTSVGGHIGHSYQSLKSESKQVPNGSADQHQYSNVVENQPSAKPDHGYTYSFQHLYQGKPEFNHIQPSSHDPQTYSYQNQQQESHQYKQEGAYSLQSTDTVAKPVFDVATQFSGHQPEVSYSYEPIQTSPEKENYAQEQPHSPDTPQITYSYSVEGGNHGYDVQNQKSSESYSNDQVRYMYVPQASASNVYAESRDTSNLQPSYSISTEQNEVNTEYPQILYQQGRMATILRDQYGSTQPTTIDKGKIPENFKSSRASEGILYYNNSEKESNSSEEFSNVKKDQVLHLEPDNSYHIENVHPSNESRGEKLGGTSSITFQKFGVADVMTTGRTKLYPVNETTSNDYDEKMIVDPYNLRSDYTQQSLRGNFFQLEETSSAATEYPYNTKVYRLPTYKVPKSKKGNRRRNNKDSSRTTKNTEDHTQAYEEDKTTTVQWYEVFTQDAPDDSTTRRTSSSKESNSHTGAAERAPFHSYHSATATTTTSSSLLPPDDTITARPTQALKRSRGSVKAYGRKKESEPKETNEVTTERLMLDFGIQLTSFEFPQDQSSFNC
ncbi:hypothetical protein GE061_008864 [Apolygus lucorum]|uniref:Uncharacterized protein n=1 Tax=Apolygus lucorum TaxID=248454 RepID=A0A8S9Y2R9_APOLU|nr:hypothetical protein GE061_008864 [Apolygus lucorum]